MVIELRLEETIEGHFGKGTGDHHGTLRTLNLKDTCLVAGNGNVEAVPLALVVARPRDEDALFGQVAGRVLEGAEAVLAPAVLELALVVVLAGKGQEELLLALLGLQRDHGLFNVVVVGFELRLKEMRLLVEGSQRSAHAFQFLGALDTSSVLGADVDGDGVEEVLVVVRVRDAAGALKLNHVLQAVLFQCSVVEI